MTIEISLGDLADPSSHRAPVDLRNHATEQLVGDLEAMILIRRAEELIGDLSASGEAKCPCHLAIGQEAVAVGVARSLTADDRLYGGHRSHSQFLALGGDPEALIAEVLGKETGCSRGMGGSMHLYGPEFGFGGSVPIVAGTVPIAVGAALAFKRRGLPHVGVAFFGDGACEEGVVHEALNMASIMKLPVLFVVENNLFSSHLDIHLRQPGNRVGRFAEAHDVAVEVVDGNDVVAVAEAGEKLISRARRGEGPGFLEAVTYRWRGHVGADENIDVGLRRSPEEIAAWKQRDPVARLEAALSSDRSVDPEEFARIRARVEERLQAALASARAAGYPPESGLLDRVYAPA
ncbi:MAG: thiamine pyrophosphate-dependent dehydrogenase E1 component subunit alpha [Aliihoeflea sp.]